MTFDEIMTIYKGSNGDWTKALYVKLAQYGPAGNVALNLFRACKTSERAKNYRGGNGKGRYRDQAYDTKSWSIDNLCEALTMKADDLGITWGWQVDIQMNPDAPHRNVIYVDTPCGQVSFHNDHRGAGPVYPGKWEGNPGQQPTRICAWIDAILNDKPPEVPALVPCEPDQRARRRTAKRRKFAQQADVDGPAGPKLL
jgi:hypothetical protein